MTLIPLPPYPADLKVKYENLIKTLSLIPKNNDFLKKIYEYLDEYNKFVKTFTKCKQSCGYCCDMPVGITLIEAEYIIKTYNKRLKIDINYLHPLKIIENQRTMKYFKICPFLNSQNDCSIYKTRPFACRTYHSLDGPEACKDRDGYHNYYGGQDPESMASGKMNLGSDVLNGLSMTILLRNKNQTIKDIKDFFPSK